MAATPYPTDYVYAGNAVALTLKTAVSDGGGDLTLTVNEETAAKGWPSLGAGQRLVIVVGRGTAYETKYAVKTITSSAAGSTLVVDSADKTFDNTPVTAAPAGTVVEHCWSATEASTANDHMRTKEAHGSDGELVDQNSAQLLSNKTVMTPTAAGHPTTKSYVDAADALALPKAGGTMTGKITLDGDPSSALHAATKQYADTMLPKAGGTMSGAIAMGSQKITGLAAGSANGEAVRYEQLTDQTVQHCRAWRTGYMSGLVGGSANIMTYTNTLSTDPALVPVSGVFTLNRTGIWLLSADMEAQEADNCVHGFRSTRLGATERSGSQDFWLSTETDGGYRSIQTARWFQSGDTVAYIVIRTTTPTLFRPAMSVTFLGAGTLA